MTAVSRTHAEEEMAYSVVSLTDRSLIRRLLEPDRAYAAYALAQLDPRLYPYNEWYRATGPAGSALIVHSSSGLGRALFATGEPEAVDVALSLHPGARFSFGSLRLEHRPVFERYFLMTRPQLMLRMAVTRDTFRPVNGEASRLRGSDVGALNRLYATEGGPSAYREGHMTEGVYYGVHEAGRLIGVAGTHVVSETEAIAVVGNVFTHPRHRGRGHATVATSAVTAHLLEFCDLVVLTVEAANEPAVRAYGKLGYETQCQLHETPLVRKEPVGLVSLARRLAAGWRGRHEGKEVVLR